MYVKEWNIDPSTWTLFLDRDGVINKKLDNAYVHSWEQFEFTEGFLKAIPVLTRYFKRIVVVTNQQGIGKKEMTIADLQKIFKRLDAEVLAAGGRIEGYYFCPHLKGDPNCNCRKPQTGMAHQAKAAFPDIDFEKSVMVGDVLTDMEFGKKLGMKTVYIINNRYFQYTYPELIDVYFQNVAAFTEAL